VLTAAAVFVFLGRGEADRPAGAAAIVPCAESGRAG
jgi:hypothetical protein